MFNVISSCILLFYLSCWWVSNPSSDIFLSIWIVSSPVFDSNGKHLYVLSSNTLLFLTRSTTTGLLTLTNTYSLSSTPSSMVMHPNGGAVYVVDSTPQVVIKLRNPSTGVLTSYSSASISSTGILRFNPTQNYLYIVSTNSILQFSVNSVTWLITALSPASVSCSICK